MACFQAIEGSVDLCLVGRPEVRDIRVEVTSLQIVAGARSGTEESENGVFERHLYSLVPYMTPQVYDKSHINRNYEVCVEGLIYKRSSEVLLQV